MLVVLIRLGHGPAGDMPRNVLKVEERRKVPQKKQEMFIFGNELGTSTHILRLSIEEQQPRCQVIPRDNDLQVFPVFISRTGTKRNKAPADCVRISFQVHCDRITVENPLKNRRILLHTQSPPLSIP